MSINGTYNITVQTPMGKETNPITFKTEGTVLTGTASSKKGDEPLEGTVDGNSAVWSMKVHTPMGPILVTVNATFDGDSMTGTIKTPLGTSKLEGVRVCG
ncbi:MAG: hypothetical protein PHF56_16465 [Desulfuromonadaceae bacterium]|nr:hypothetical protein [Desulfuromonadaceae bacterium]